MLPRPSTNRSFSSSLRNIVSRFFHSDLSKKQITIFENERRRQAQITNINKAIITVKDKQGQNKNLLMNNRSSSFYDCLKHFSQPKIEQTALVHVVDSLGDRISSLHEKIVSEATIEFIEFRDKIFGNEVNSAFWKTCSFVLGAAIKASFRNEVHLLDPEPLTCNDGRFSYSAEIDGLTNWQPSKEEIETLLHVCRTRFIAPCFQFNPLHVSQEIALELFSDNPYKQEQIKKKDEVTVYSIGDHLDICDGPLISTSRQIGRICITDVHNVGPRMMFTGVALPAVEKCSSYSWSLLTSAARDSSTYSENVQLNCAKIS